MLLSLAAVLLTACDPFASPEGLFEEYVTRTARVLDGEVVLTPVPTLDPLPRRRERMREIPALDVSMLDFLGLYGCELQHVIGERNSIMGRVMHPATVFDYEVRFLRTARECAETIDSERLAARIREIIEAKRAQIPDAAWNAVWGTGEIEDFLSRSGGSLAVEVERDLASTMASDLRALVDVVGRVQGGDLGVDVKLLDGVYQRWQARPLAGQALRAAMLATIRLDDASRLIEARLGERPMCARPDLQPRAAENMRGMFMSVYVGRVQPYLADLQRVRRELMPPLQALASIGGGRSETVVSYARRMFGDEDEASLWRSFDLAVARHTRAWQDLLEQCGMRPGQETG
ncbi:MAG: DUF3080 domain-containing protein [Pseudazoarcus pumilus]|nr:DUF3080 domain-containing protein [Pseudazoarcus pumilus]